MTTDNGNRGGTKKRGLGAVLILLSGLCWAPVAIAGKICIQSGVDEISLNVVRMTFGAGFMTVLFLASRRSRRQIPLRPKLIASVLGALVFVVGGLSFFASLRYIEASMAYLLIYSHPAVVLTFSIVIGWEKYATHKVFSVLMTFIGVALVLRVGGELVGEAWFGVLFVMVTTLIYSVYVLVSDRLLSAYSSRQISFYSMAAAALMMYLLIPFTNPNIDFLLSNLTVLGLVMMAAMGTGLSLVFFLAGIRHVGAFWAAIINTVQPIFVLLLAWTVLGEDLTWMQLVGALLLVSGVLFARQQRKVHDTST